MGFRGFGVAVLVTCCALAGMVRAQDVTLTARDGGLALDGVLLGWDGEFYRIDTSYGPLTVDGQGVICDGPGCPDLTAPKAQVRLVGEAGPGQALTGPLVAAFAAARGLDAVTDGVVTWLVERAGGQVLAEFSFEPMAHDAALAALAAGRAELVVSVGTAPDFGARVLAMDALVPVAAPDNPLAKIASVDLARVLSGEVSNWAEVGGPDMPLVLHGLAPGSGVADALAARLGRDVAATKVHGDLAALADAVARDPWAIAVTTRGAAGKAKPLLLTDKCGFPLLPSSLAVKAEDYPLALPLHLLTPRRRLPLMAREFLEFLALPDAQAAISAAGYVDRGPERQALTGDGLRLMNAIAGAGEETSLDDLKRLVGAMDGAERVSLTFRFEDGSSTLEAASQENLTDLARMLDAGLFRNESLVLAGFSDGSGAAAANLALSQSRAKAVRDALAAVVAPDTALPEVMAFGEAMPMACDETTAGRRLNRRVELWVRPAMAKGDPAPEN
ncbi:phosphate ABC transporter substrate-binding/OmpA family protein [Paragemmobacter straminiformis]|uniref:OmpA family protein n=1 Tax=Paragemmobacter straminiformis TaxID=2045119 RepID=A0A842I9C4_9RHOB|nr:phosphate ABC transporter substrate-binding/OmpA family protein [Gemmobacter straminiformis]MBC2836216.1 OmpA family protein [Gemmobacter straminiformis]